MKILKEYPIYAQLAAVAQRKQEFQDMEDNFAARDAEPLQSCQRCGQLGRSDDMTDSDCNLCNPVVRQIPFPHNYGR